MRNFHTELTLFSIEQQIETTRSHTGQLAHDNILRHSSHRIDFSVSSGVIQDVHGFFEGTSHKGTGILSVDTVTCDGHQVTLRCHDVTKQGQMTIVYVKTVELQHVVHFLLHGLSHSFDSEHLEDLANIVTGRTHRIDVPFAQHLHHGRSVRFQQPLSDGLELSFGRNDDTSLGVRLGQMHVHLSDGFDSLQGHVRQHVSLDTTQEHVVLHLVHIFLVVILELVVLVVHDTNTQHQLVGVVVVEDTVQIISETGIDLFRNLFHGQLLIRHTLAVQLDTQQPGRDSRRVKIGHFVVHVDELLILGDHRPLWVWIVVDGGICRHLTQRRVFQPAQHVLGLFGVTSRTSSQEYG